MDNKLIALILLLAILLGMTNPILLLFLIIVVGLIIYYKYKIEKSSRIKSSYRDFDYTGMSIYSFYFKEQQYNVDTWKGLLIEVLSLMYTFHEEEFDNILYIPGRRRQYFTRHPEKLHIAEEIENTGIYTETKLGSNGIVGLCYDVIQLFGYSDDDLVIEAY